MFIVASSKVDSHVGEEYDDILEVDDQPTTETIQEWANRVRNHIRRLWTEDVPPEGADRADDDPREVRIHLDAATPFHAMLVNLQILMKEEESIDVELAYTDTTERTTSDQEAREILQRLEHE